MAYCEKKGLYCSLVCTCEQTTESCSLPDWVEKEIVFTAEDLERMYQESAEETEINTFQELLTKLTERGSELIKDYHAATKSCEDLQKEVYSLRAELIATKELLASFEQGNIVAPVLQDKIVDYLTDLYNKPISRKTAINKIIEWVKNDFKN